MEKIEPIRAPFEMPLLTRPAFPERTFSIADFGATPGMDRKNTGPIAEAIRACHEAGGGTVLVPPGVWRTGPVHLKSQVNLHIAEGAELHFSDDFADYLPEVFTRWEGMECWNYSPLIYAVDCENIGITGKGTLFGHGEKWHPWKGTQIAVAAEPLNALCAEGAPVEQRRMARENGLRPPLIQPIRCRNVLIEGLRIEGSPFWTVHPVYCERLIVRRLSIRTWGPNTDGINLDSCRDGLVEHCDIDTGDDSICLKSGINEDGRRVGVPCERIVIRHCSTQGGHGAVTIGSEMSGGVRQIYCHDYKVRFNDRAVRIKSRAGRGGFVRDVHFEDFDVERCGELVEINLRYAASTVEPKTALPPDVRGIVIRNLRCGEARWGLRIVGIPDGKIRNVAIENVSVDVVTESSAIIDEVVGLALKNVRLGEPE
jgi:polygalacturonase